MIDFSIIIPTYNRFNVLKKSLIAYQNQSFKNFEIIVIDDNSQDRTYEKLKNLKFPYNLIVKKNPGKKQSASRNFALSIAKGKYIILTGDDIIPSVDFIQQHSISLNKKPERDIIIGKVEWHKDIPKHPLYYFLTEESGIQNAFWAINDYENVSYLYWYSGNCSFKSNSLFKKILFNTDLHTLEDLERAYRIYKMDAIGRYNPKAIAYHLHLIDLQSYYKRQILVGKNFENLFSLQPELKKHFWFPDTKPKKEKLINDMITSIYTEKRIVKLLEKLKNDNNINKYNILWNELMLLYKSVLVGASLLGYYYPKDCDRFL